MPKHMIASTYASERGRTGHCPVLSWLAPSVGERRKQTARRVDGKRAGCHAFEDASVSSRSKQCLAEHACADVSGAPARGPRDLSALEPLDWVASPDHGPVLGRFGGCQLGPLPHGLGDACDLGHGTHAVITAGEAFGLGRNKNEVWGQVGEMLGRGLKAPVHRQ